MANFISWAKLIFYYLRADVRFGTRGARPAAQRWRGDSGKATFVADFGAKATRKKRAETGGSATKLGFYFGIGPKVVRFFTPGAQVVEFWRGTAEQAWPRIGVDFGRF